MKLDGREFDGLTQALTARQNDYVTLHLRLSGAWEILLAQTDDPKARHDDCINRILESGRKYNILAGLLTERGKKWTREDAERNAEAFGDSRELDEQDTMNSELINLISAFFRFGGPSSKTSRTSSSQSEKAPESSSEEASTMAISGT